MRARYLLIAAAWAVTFGVAQAETLGEATLSAMQYNPVLRGERARLEATRETLPIAWAEALPQISLDFSAFDRRTTEPSFGVAVRENRRHWIGSVRSSTLLYGGGRVWSSTRQARAQIAEGVARYQDTTQNLILEITRAYGDVRQEQATLAAQEQAAENYAEQRRYVAAHVRTGFLTQTDLAQADSRLANARSELALARARLVAANEAYTRLVGHPPMDLHPPQSITGLPEDANAAVALAMQDSPVIVAQLASYEASDAAIDVAASRGRFNVTVETGDSALGAYDNPAARREESEDSVSLRVAVPLFTGGRNRAAVRQQRHLRDAEREDLDEVRRRVREGVNVAWANLTAARARVESNLARVEAAELANRGVQREQEIGERTVIDVLDQENELLQARISMAQAERQAMVAERELAARLGMLDTLARQAESVGEPPPL